MPKKVSQPFKLHLIVIVVISVIQGSVGGRRECGKVRYETRPVYVREKTIKLCTLAGLKLIQK